MTTTPRRVVAIASAGGHFNQLMLMRPGYETHKVTYLTTLAGLPDQFGALPARIVPDCNANTPLRAVRSFFAIGAQIVSLRPHVVISTGALPGVMALVWGRVVGAHTIWVDSVANAEELSASGRLAKKFAHLTLSQWQTVAETTGATYKGSVL